ncbi:protein serine/threonine phosphatase 2C, partial [Eremomyces bilateralis CBS 781.70]
PPLSFCIAASYSAKNHPFDPHRDLFKYDPSVRSKLSTLRPRPGIRPQSGQDSFFVSDVGETGTVAFGVVDGVGGWESSGVDPAHFAHGLCDHMAMGAARYPAEFRAGPLRPRELLQYGYDQVMSTDEIVAGGSTACVASIEPNGRLNVANLGDSGFIHLGPNHVRHFSKPQTHAFNTPYQLSKIPPFMQLQMRLFGPAEAHAETPADAHLSHHQLHPGDVLIFATDGVWDNLSPEDTLKLVGRTMQANGAWVVGEEGVTIGNLRGGQGTKDGGGECQLCSALAVAVTREAKEASLNGMREGPFAREVRRHFPGEQWMGGKPDDICTVVAVVRE